MQMHLTQSTAALIASLPPQERKAILDGLDPEHIGYLWRFWARPDQIAPEGDWRTWLLLGGRGAGKTRSGAEFIREEIKAGCGRVALVAPTAADARDVMVEGPSGILSVCWKHDVDYKGNLTGRPHYEPSKRRLTWENGAVATLFSADEPDRLRGPQYDGAWSDEVAAWNRMREAWDMLQFGLRLETRDARPPRQVVTTTPRPVPLVRELVKDSGTVISRASTYANVANLSAAFIKTMRDKYEGTRLGRQEIAAEILDDVPGALWTRDMIDAARLQGQLPQMDRIVVAIDPSGTSGDDGERADSVGIVVAGKGRDGLGYILADRTCDLSPAGWGRIAVDAYHEFKADRIVAERNYGGAMVEHVIRTVDARVPYKEVTASRGKVVRAEPVAALYEQKRVRHVRGLNELEGQMVNMASEGYLGSGSPDRLDAMVWAMTELMTGADRTGKLVKVEFG